MQKFNLDPDEKVLLIARRYFFTLFRWVFVAFFLIVMPFFLMFPLFAWGKWGIAFFIYSIAVGIILFLKIYIVWYFNTLVITNKRVIKVKQYGFFDRKIFEIMISRINNVSYHIKGVWGTILRYGSLRVTAVNGETTLNFANMKNPGDGSRILNNLLQNVSIDLNE